MNLWQRLAKSKKPFLALAPMEEVTDTVFRQMVARVARPDVMFTEFTNVDGLQSAGREKLIHRLKFTEEERPIVAQIWGKDPKNFYEATKLIKELRFDGVDINMGCPDKDVVKGGCGIALINNRSLAEEIIAAVREGVGDLPVSVKTRIGLNKIQTEDWCGWLLEQKLDALTVHGRTAKEKSDVPTHWDEIAKVVSLRDQSKSKTLIIGNGDVKNALDARRYALDASVDGVMIGRGIFENIAAFSAKGQVLSAKENTNLLQK
ncbi:MAG: tRNA-dihydrouridine synthase family protein, partial [Patescibacteria group bacterium]